MTMCLKTQGFLTSNGDPSLAVAERFQMTFRSGSFRQVKKIEDAARNHGRVETGLMVGVNLSDFRLILSIAPRAKGILKDPKAFKAKM